MSKWLNHTQLDVCEKKKTSMFPILDTNLCITLSSYPLALLSSAFASCCVCSIDRSVSHWKKARRLPHAPAPRHRSCGFGRRAARGSRLSFASLPGSSWFAPLRCTTAAIAHAAAASRRSSWLSFFLLSSTMWEESSLSINPHCTIEKVHGLTPTKMLEIWTIYQRKTYLRFIRGRKWASFYISDCVELDNLFQKYDKMYGANLSIKWMSLLISNQLHI